MELKCHTYNMKPKVAVPPPVVLVANTPQSPIYRETGQLRPGSNQLRPGFYHADALLNGSIYRLYLYCQESGCRVLNMKFIGNQPQLVLSNLRLLSVNPKQSILTQYLV